jgi:TrmH family RNA methyltransferase
MSPQDNPSNNSTQSTVIISSVHNPTIKYVRGLQARSKERRTEKAFIIEGVRLLEEAQDSDWEMRLVLYSEELSERGMQQVETFQSQGTKVEAVSSKVMRAVSDTETPQGILAVMGMRSLPIPEVLDLVLVLDQLRDPGNLGTILRSAAAVSVQAVFLTPGTADQFSPKVMRGAMGAHFRIPVHNADWEEIRSRLVDSGLRSYLAAVNRGQVYYQVDYRPPLALIIGGEANGAGETAYQTAESLIHIPMPGGGDSLNSSVAAGILLFEIVRQRGMRS